VQKLELMGDEFQIARIKLLEGSVKAVKSFASLFDWWEGEKTQITSTARELKETSVARLRPMRASLKALEKVNDEYMEKVFAMRAGNIELYWPNEIDEQKNFIKEALKNSRKLAQEIYDHWRTALDEEVGKLKSFTPEWRTKEDLTAEPIRSELLLNPAYAQLPKMTGDLDSTLEAVKLLHSDGCGIVVSPEKLTEADGIKQDAIDTVSVTFTVYQLTQHIPKLMKVEDKKTAAQGVMDGLKEKGYTIPEHLQKALEKHTKAAPKD
jgi:hypothetical protein